MGIFAIFTATAQCFLTQQQRGDERTEGQGLQVKDTNAKILSGVARTHRVKLPLENDKRDKANDDENGAKAHVGKKLASEVTCGGREKDQTEPSARFIFL